MNNKNTNRVNMINTTIAYSDANTAATAGIPAFAIALAAVKAKMILVNSLNQIAGGTSKGVTTDTNLLRKAMTELAVKCVNGTTAYANSVNNNTLKALVNFPKSKLDALKKEDVDDICEAIHDATNANIAAVANFGVVAADVTDLQAAIDLFRTATQNPRQAIISKSQATKHVNEMVKDVIENYFKAQMDKMVNTLQVSNKDFWDGYQQAREVLDLGTNSAKVRGTVKDKNDVPLKDVSFLIFETGTNVLVKQVASDVKGKFNASKLPAGNFDLRWEKDGYTMVSETNVHISAGKDLQRKIVMSAVAVREGDVAPGAIVNIDITGVMGTPSSNVSIEGGASNLRFYGSTTPSGAPGGLFVDVPAGTDMVKTAEQFMALTGLGDSVPFLNVQNMGAVTSHFKLTIDNLE